MEFEIDGFFFTMFAIGSFLLIFGLLSLFVRERLYISETLLATLFGLGVGKYSKFITVDGKMMMQFSRLVLCFQVICVGMLVPKNYIKKEWKSLFMFLVPVMFISCFISTVVIKLVLGLDIYTSFIIGACITPTDPVLATTVTKGKFANRYIPQHLKNLLTIESGANDGLGFPILMIPILLLKYNSDYGKSAYEWVKVCLLFEVVLATIVGAMIGYLARKMLYFSKKYNLIDKESYLGYILALAMVVTGITAITKMDDILACFVTGIFFTWDSVLINEIKESHLYEVLDLVVNLSFFVFFGASFRNSDIKVRYFLAAGAALLVKRLPLVMLFKPLIPQLFSFKEAFFAGWYGPVGVGAVFFSFHAVESLAKNESLKSASNHKQILDVVNIIVLSSVIVHGITAPIIHIHLRKKEKKKPAEISQSEYTEDDYTEEESECSTDIEISVIPKERIQE